MNSLSWLIYVAGVVGSVKTLFIVFAGGAAAFIVIGTSTTAVAESYGDAPEGLWLKWVKWAWLPLVAGAFAALIPSPSTVYLIAASEVDEVVVTSPETVEMMGDLKAIIKKRLKDELGEVAK